MANDYVLSVTQLNEYVSSMLRRETLLQGIGVRGEISGFKRHSSGHLYFSLKDEGALVRCVMFRREAMGLREALQDGMQVVARGSVSLYVRDGQYQLYVQDVEAQGEGELYRRFMLLKTRLEAQGLFDPAHKRQLPALPGCIGVVTSSTGAVLHDIMSVTRRRFPNMPVVLYPARVQGEGAAASVARGIRVMNERGLADVLIVGRGGGSLEDLWAFNEECVARAIYESRIPVVSAVGHETDFTIADFTADCRAATPSAAAELCVPEYGVRMQWLGDMQEALFEASRAMLQAQRQRIGAIRESAVFASPGFALKAVREKLANTKNRLVQAAQAQTAAGRENVAVLNSRLQALSPYKVLERGYALIRAEKGYVARVAELSAGQAIELVMADGTRKATVNETVKGK